MIGTTIKNDDDRDNDGIDDDPHHCPDPCRFLNIVVALIVVEYL